jgi:hypothetical protein
MRQIFAPLLWEKKAVVFFSALAILVALGPFGTYTDLSLGRRFVYWTVLMIGIGFFMHVSMSVSLRTPYLGRSPQFVRIILGSMIAAIPGTAILVFVNDVYRQDPLGEFNLIIKWGQIVLLGIVIGAVEYMDWRAPEKPVAPEIQTAFHKRLTADLGRDIISLSMQDHYVEVTTTQGKDMLLIRFADALNEISALPGQRIHRSHWVAAAHLTALDKDGPRHVATLSDGRKLPVSATYADAAAAMLHKTQLA